MKKIMKKTGPAAFSLVAYAVERFECDSDETKSTRA